MNTKKIEKLDKKMEKYEPRSPKWNKLHNKKQALISADTKKVCQEVDDLAANLLKNNQACLDQNSARVHEQFKTGNVASKAVLEQCKKDELETMQEVCAARHPKGKDDGGVLM